MAWTDPDYGKKYYQAHKEERRAFYFAHKDEAAARSRKHYLKDPEKMCARTRKWGDEHPERRMLNLSRKRARTLGLDFTIEESDIIIPEICPYLKTKLLTTGGRGQHNDNVSLDRKDSTKGYIKGNVQVISHLANTMKNSASKEQLLQFATSILEMENQ